MGKQLKKVLILSVAKYTTSITPPPLHATSYKIQQVLSGATAGHWLESFWLRAFAPPLIINSQRLVLCPLQAIAHSWNNNGRTAVRTENILAMNFVVVITASHNGTLLELRKDGYNHAKCGLVEVLR